MGFFDSLKGQLGRDSGRVVSSFIFGNKHATKYQRVDNNNSKIIKSNLKTQRDYELEILEQEQENEIEEKKAFVNQNLKKIISMKIPNSKELLIEQLHSLSVEITSNKWKDTEEDVNKISNIYTDAVFKKYEQYLFTLKTKFPNAVEIQYFEKQRRAYQKQAFFQKHKLAFIVILFVLFIVWGITSGYFERSDKETRQRNKELIDKIFN